MVAGRVVVRCWADGEKVRDTSSQHGPPLPPRQQRGLPTRLSLFLFLLSGDLKCAWRAGTWIVHVPLWQKAVGSGWVGCISQVRFGSAPEASHSINGSYGFIKKKAEEGFKLL